MYININNFSLAIESKKNSSYKIYSCVTFLSNGASTICSFIIFKYLPCNLKMPSQHLYFTYTFGFALNSVKTHQLSDNHGVC